MKTIVRTLRKSAAVAVCMAGVLFAGCGLDKSGVDPITGPSAPAEFGLSVTLTATPDQLPRDGASQSTITVFVRDAAGKPVSGQRLSVASTVGTLSQSDVVTGPDGKATFTFRAPPFGTVGNAAIIQVTPLGGDGTAQGRNVSIVLTGGSNSTAPTAAFTFSPAVPTLQEPVTLDATTTTDEGSQCGDACTYTWDMGGEATVTGRVISYRFRAVRTYAVTLTATDSTGSSGKTTQSVGVTTGSEPVAAFTSSPANPGQFEAVQFNASTSRAGAGTGRTIVSYAWKFGDGATASGATASHAYSVVGTYQVSLTVTDSVGLTNTVTNPITIINGLTASFTISPSPSSTTRETIFDAEGSQGSDTGFGTRNPITQYIWNFGESTDTETTSNRLIGHTYSRAGIYTVTLTVVDNANRRATTTRSITIN